MISRHQSKVSKEKKIKKSIFYKIPKKEMEFYGKMLTLKQISYKGLLEKIKGKYSYINVKTHQSLRYFMITNKYVLNEKSFNNINKNIEKTKLVKKKQEGILKSLMNKILSDEVFLKEFFENDLVKQKILDIVKGN